MRWAVGHQLSVGELRRRGVGAHPSGSDQGSSGSPAGRRAEPESSEPEHCASDDPALFWRCAQEKATAFDPPRTADGRPDFSGYWRHGTEAKEDLEAPWDNRARVGASRAGERDAGPGKSLIVDPADGKLPLQPWAEVQRRENEASYIDQNTLCFLSGVPRFMYESGAYQILQAPESITSFPSRSLFSRHRTTARRVSHRPSTVCGRAWQVGQYAVFEPQPTPRWFLDRQVRSIPRRDVTGASRGSHRNTSLRPLWTTVVTPTVHIVLLTLHTMKDFEILEDSFFEGNKTDIHYSIGSRITPKHSQDVPALRLAPCSRNGTASNCTADIGLQARRQISPRAPRSARAVLRGAHFLPSSAHCRWRRGGYN